MRRLLLMGGLLSGDYCGDEYTPEKIPTDRVKDNKREGSRNSSIKSNKHNQKIISNKVRPKQFTRRKV